MDDCIKALEERVAALEKKVQSNQQMFAGAIGILTIEMLKARCPESAEALQFTGNCFAKMAAEGIES